MKKTDKFFMTGVNFHLYDVPRYQILQEYLQDYQYRGEGLEMKEILRWGYC